MRNSLFCNLPQKEINRLQLLQNCAARLLTFTKKTTHISPVLRSLHWLPIEKRVAFKILLLVYHTLNKSAPTYLQSILSPYVPARTLRSSTSNNLKIPRVKHSWGERSFSFIGPKLWNELPTSIRNIPSLDTFKTSLKSHLFSQT